MKNKISILSSFGAGAAALLTTGVAAAQEAEAGILIADADLSPQIRYVLEQQEALPNQDTYVVVDKTNRELLIVENGRITLRDPVLIGKEEGDAVPVMSGRSATNAGRYEPVVRTDEEAYRNYYRNTNILFDCNQEFTRCSAIHGLWTQVASENRIQRYESPTAADNAITNGCVNVEYSIQDRLIALFQQRNADGSPIQLIIPPSQDTSVQNTNLYLGYE